MGGSVTKADANGYAAVFSSQTDPLIELVTRALGLRRGLLAPDGKVVKLPPFPGIPATLSAAATPDRIVVAAGAAADQIPGLLGTRPSGDSPLFSLGMDFSRTASAFGLGSDAILKPLANAGAIFVVNAQLRPRGLGLTFHMRFPRGMPDFDEWPAATEPASTPPEPEPEDEPEE